MKFYFVIRHKYPGPENKGTETRMKGPVGNGRDCRAKRVSERKSIGNQRKFKLNRVISTIRTVKPLVLSTTDSGDTAMFHPGKRHPAESMTSE